MRSSTKAYFNPQLLSLREKWQFNFYPQDIVERQQHSWASATISLPTLEHFSLVSSCYDRLVTLYKGVVSGDPLSLEMLQEFYTATTMRTRTLLQKIYGRDDLAVILDTNGTSAISFIQHLIPLGDGDKILTTTEGGSYVPSALLGRNPWNNSGMFFPISGIFWDYPRGEYTDLKLRRELVGLRSDDQESKTDREIVEEIIVALEKDEAIGIVLIPQVSKSGRILPTREIGDYIQTINSSDKRKKIYYIVDQIQTLGRSSAEELQAPLDYCDYTVVSSSKGLGGVLVSSAILGKEDNFCKDLKNLKQSSRLRNVLHYQTVPGKYPEIDALLTEHSSAISLPEVASFNLALERHYLLGKGVSYEERRKNQIKRVKGIESILASSLQSLQGVSVLDDAVSHVPSIISFVPASGRSMKIKEEVQSGRDGPAVILSANIGKIMRIAISEYKLPTMDEQSVLLETIERAVRNC